MVTCVKLLNDESQTLTLILSGALTSDSLLTSKMISFPSSKEVLCCTHIILCYEDTPEKSHSDSSIVALTLCVCHIILLRSERLLRSHDIITGEQTQFFLTCFWEEYHM